MNKIRLIVGIVCLALAVLLAVLNLTLPPESFRFNFSDDDPRWDWAPAIIFGIVGIVFLASAWSVRGESAQATSTPVIDPSKAELNKRFESIGWGLFLIMIGGFAFIPKETVDRGFWSIGIGLIMLGLNAARYFNGIKMSGFTTFLGLLAVLGGTAELLGYTSLEGGMLLIILGAYLLIKPALDKRQLFGKAEEKKE